MVRGGKEGEGRVEGAGRELGLQPTLISDEEGL